ncbi:MAG: cytochrome c oxidase assembly protein, partial [Alphaproteobacteria bacterium]|nr:cytochrome c oxidase assembly protein [Alphaproteobacteria bacterium]
MSALALLTAPKNRPVVLSLAILATMGALGYYSYALYRIFCSTTGYNGTTQVAAAAPGAVAGQTMLIRFDTNTDPKLPWVFKPEAQSQVVTIGA